MNFESPKLSLLGLKYLFEFLKSLLNSRKPYHLNRTQKLNLGFRYIDGVIVISSVHKKSTRQSGPSNCCMGVPNYSCGPINTCPSWLDLPLVVNTYQLI